MKSIINQGWQFLYPFQDSLFSLNSIGSLTNSGFFDFEQLLYVEFSRSHPNLSWTWPTLTSEWNQRLTEESFKTNLILTQMILTMILGCFPTLPLFLTYVEMDPPWGDDDIIRPSNKPEIAIFIHPGSVTSDVEVSPDNCWVFFWIVLDINKMTWMLDSTGTILNYVLQFPGASSNAV